MGSTTRHSEAERATTGPGGARAWIGRELRGAPREPRDLLRDILAARPATALRALAGRATFRWPADPAVVVKRYSAPDWRDFVHDLLRGRARSVAQREADNLRELAHAGIPVPEAYGWCDGGALSGPSAVWMQHLEHSCSLADACEREADAARRFAPELAGFVARLHAGGWYHRDLYLGHWLVTAAGLFLVDVGRARRERSPRTRWFVKDLAALLHSCPPSVSAQARLRFLVLYLDARGIASHDERKSFARAVLAKATRIAAHVPRWRDPVTGQ